MVTLEQIERYRTDGLLVIDDVLSVDQIEHGRRIVDAFTEHSRDVPSSNDVYDLEPGHSAARPMIRWLKSPVRLDPFFDQLIRVGLTATGADCANEHPVLMMVQHATAMRTGHHHTILPALTLGR